MNKAYVAPSPLATIPVEIAEISAVEVAILNILSDKEVTRSVVTKKLSNKFKAPSCRQEAITNLVDFGAVKIVSFPTPSNGRAPTVYRATPLGELLLSKVKAGVIKIAK